MQIVGKIISSETMHDAFQTFTGSKAELEKSSKHVFDDIFDKRNDHLIKEIEAVLKTHSTVVVPWGAGHMPEIQKRIEKWGVVETKRTRHLVVPFENTTLIALFSLIGRIPKGANP